MSLGPEVGAAIAPLPAGYAVVLEQVIRALDRDRRVLALWLGGSVGRGIADAGSDLDLIVTVVDDSWADLVGDGTSTWTFLAPVLSFEIPGLPGSFALTTPDGLRVDAVLEKDADIAGTSYRHRVPVFDRRSDPTPVPAPDDRDRGPDVARLEAVVREFARQLAIFPDAVVARQDWLLGQEAVHNYRLFLRELYVESNRPLPPMGIKQWSAKLTAAQRDRLASLQVPATDRESVIEAMQQVCQVIRTEGRALLESAGGTWPSTAVDAGLVRWESRGLGSGPGV